MIHLTPIEVARVEYSDMTDAGSSEGIRRRDIRRVPVREYCSLGAVITEASRIVDQIMDGCGLNEQERDIVLKRVSGMESTDQLADRYGVAPDEIRRVVIRSVSVMRRQRHFV